jgi:5-formyltetrahydrofolate cyclo-ligase
MPISPAAGDRPGGAIAVTDRVAAGKRELRRRIRHERAARSDAARRQVAEAVRAVLLELGSLQRARCVAVYASVGGEPGTGPLRESLRVRGVDVLLPIVLGHGRLDWAADTGVTAPRGGLGGPEPTGPRLGAGAIAHADLVIVPALAVDTEGYRLGQGGGYYDRALPMTSPGTLCLALVHDEEVLDAAVEQVPREAHDVRICGIVTPSRWMLLDPDRRT